MSSRLPLTQRQVKALCEGAKRAAIACGERGFWTFLGVSSADDAKADICRRCGITTRRMLDHDERAAAIWENIDRTYRLWLDGRDVELD